MRNIRSEIMLYTTTVIVIILVILGSISYRWTKGIIELRVSESTVETLKQIDKNLHSMVGDAQDISLFIISNRNVRNYLSLDKNKTNNINNVLLYLNEDLANLGNSKSYISAINIYGDNGLSFETSGPSQYMNKILQGKYEELIPDNGNYIITPTYKRNYQAMGEQYVMSFYREINNIYNFSQKLGIMRLDINENVINKIYKDTKLGDTGYIFIANKDGNIVSHRDKNQISNSMKEKEYFNSVFSNDDGYYREKINGEDVLVTHYTSKEQNLIFVSVVPYKELINQVNVVRNMTIIVILLASGFAFVITYLISLKITTPIKKLTKIMLRVEEGNLDVIANVERKDEIGALSRSFNSMISKLKTLIDEVYKNQISRKEAELRALQAQINPHFLYNTLDSIYWSARMEGAFKTGEIVNALAKLFRLALNKGDEITTVEKEVEHLQSYLIIQKMRYTQEPDIVIDVDPAIYTCKTIKLILQPLVENALLHGVSELEKKGIIKINGKIVGEDILFEVIDNGVGMDEETIRDIFKCGSDEKKGYGIKNVDERIKLYFGEEYGIKIYSEIGKGTKVEIMISQNIKKLEVGTND
jgi:two-component system sensor histidine kinase YesM